MNRYNVIMVRPPPPAVQHLQLFTIVSLNRETCVTATCLQVTSGRLISSSISSVARCKPTCKASSTHDNTCGNSGPESTTYKDPKTPLLPCALWFLQPCNRRNFFLLSIYLYQLLAKFWLSSKYTSARRFIAPSSNACSSKFAVYVLPKYKIYIVLTVLSDGPSRPFASLDEGGVVLGYSFTQNASGRRNGHINSHTQDKNGSWYDPAGTESWNMQIRYETTKLTMHPTNNRSSPEWFPCPRSSSKINRRRGFEEIPQIHRRQVSAK